MRTCRTVKCGLLAAPNKGSKRTTWEYYDILGRLPHFFFYLLETIKFKKQIVFLVWCERINHLTPIILSQVLRPSCFGARWPRAWDTDCHQGKWSRTGSYIGRANLGGAKKVGGREPCCSPAGADLQPGTGSVHWWEREGTAGCLNNFKLQIKKCLYVSVQLYLKRRKGKSDIFKSFSNYIQRYQRWIRKKNYSKKEIIMVAAQMSTVFI